MDQAEIKVYAGLFMENSHAENPDKFGVALCGFKLPLKRNVTPTKPSCQRCRKALDKRNAQAQITR